MRGAWPASCGIFSWREGSLAKFYRWILKCILESLTNSEVDAIASSGYKSVARCETCTDAGFDQVGY